MTRRRHRRPGRRVSLGAASCGFQDTGKVKLEVFQLEFVRETGRKNTVPASENRTMGGTKIPFEHPKWEECRR